jgi:hypothetical protein
MPTKRKPKTKYPKLRGLAKILAPQYIAEEEHTGKYSHAQARAIGISRARTEAANTKTANRLRHLFSKY